MKILIIGGTRFVGRHLTESATSKGHELTVFHRGSTPSNGLPPMTEILGDRTSDIDKLSQGSWDAVIDTCGYHPAHVESMARALSGLTAQYVYISSISAYADFSTPNFGEDAPLTRLDPTQQETFQNLDPNRNHDAMGLGDLYGPLKAMCEDAVTRVFGNESLIVRAGLIVGKYDWTDRFTYWVMRTANGGKVLAPFGPEAPVQIIDARDLADWIVKMIENRGTGVFNVAGVPGMTDFGIMLNCAREVTGSDAEFVWADDQFMADHDIAPWSDMPVYVPETDETKGFSSASVEKAVASGLTFRTLSETVQETYEWRSKSGEKLKAGLSTEREAELLELLWNERD